MAVSSPTMADKYGERESIFFVMIEGEESSWMFYGKSQSFIYKQMV